MKQIFLRIIKSDNFLVKVSSGLLILVFSFVLIDLFLWLFFPVSIEQETKSEMYQSIAGLKNKVLYQRNKFGLRSMSIETAIVPKNTYRILCLGGSTTDQANQNIEDTWSGILEMKLQNEFRENGIKIEVAAYGRGGETVMDRCVWTRENLHIYNPNLVITMEGINDMCWHGGIGYKYEKLNRSRDYQKLALINSVKSSFKKKCLKYSQVSRRMRVLKNNLKTQYLKKKGKIVEWHTKNLPNLRKEYKSLPYDSNPIRNPDPLEEFADGIFVLADYVTKTKADLIILGQPVIWNKEMTPEQIDSLWFFVNTSAGQVRASPTWLAKEIERYNEIQRQTAINYEADFIDLDERIPKKLLYFFDDCHFTDLGSEFVAAEIFPYAVKHIQKYLNHDSVVPIDLGTN